MIYIINIQNSWPLFNTVNATYQPKNDINAKVFFRWAELYILCGYEQIKWDFVRLSEVRRRGSPDASVSRYLYQVTIREKKTIRWESVVQIYAPTSNHSEEEIQGVRYQCKNLKHWKIRLFGAKDVHKPVVNYFPLSHNFNGIRHFPRDYLLLFVIILVYI